MIYASVFAIVKSSVIVCFVLVGAQPEKLNVVLPVIVAYCTSPNVVLTTTVPETLLPKLYVVLRNVLIAALLIKVLAILLSIAMFCSPDLTTTCCCSSVISVPAVLILFLIEVKLSLNP